MRYIVVTLTFSKILLNLKSCDPVIFRDSVLRTQWLETLVLFTITLSNDCYKDRLKQRSNDVNPDDDDANPNVDADIDNVKINDNAPYLHDYDKAAYHHNNADNNALR